MLMTAAVEAPGSPFKLKVAEAVARIRARNETLRAFITTRTDEALAEASAREREPPRSPLHGVPYSLKDQWDTAGIRTTCGSHRFRDRVPTESGAVHEAFAGAGAILLGKTNLSDLGIAPEATSFVGGATRNPHDLSRTAGGSSGGAAAAVADGMSAFDWGTDIGGSIRMPAAYCGVFGLRLSSATWPIRGMFPKLPAGLTWMCGQGPITRSIAEMRAVLAAAAPILRTGPSRPFELKGVALYTPEVAGAWPTFSADARPRLERASERPLLEAGLPSMVELRNLYSAIWASHFEDLVAADESIELAPALLAVLSAILLRGRFGDRRFHPLTAELLALIALGRFTLFRSRERTMKRVNALRARVEACWDRGLVIAAPVCVFHQPKIGRSTRNLHLISCAVLGNISDATGLAVPFGTFAGSRLPRALQLLGPPGCEDVLLDLGEKIADGRIP
jgi:Asp-tRNA(Asn)/Glu-tRNA(Gln) amidotransferase A subunit family amidase